MTTAPKAHRGSRKHVLDWTARHDFLTDFAELVALPGLDLSGSTFKPRGVASPDEAHWQALFCGHALDVGVSSALERRLASARRRRGCCAAVG